MNILASMFFAGISGSCVADSAAIGSMLIPAMVEDGYDPDFSVAVTASSSTIGPIIPPSILMVLYGYLANVSIGRLFLGGFIPGVLIGLGLMVTSYIICLRRGYKNRGNRVTLQEGLAAFRGAAWALVIPAIIVGSVVTGAATATEAGVVAVVLALIISVFILRTIRSLSHLRTIIINAAVMTTVVMLILGMSAIFGTLLARVRFQQVVIDLLFSITSNPSMMLLLICAFLFVLGFFVAVTAMLVMFAAPLSAVGLHLGFDPVHFGVVIVMVALIGAVTPPVGSLLFIGCSIAKIPLKAVLSIIWPFVLTLLLVAVLVSLFPNLVLFLPRLLIR